MGEYGHCKGCGDTIRPHQLTESIGGALYCIQCADELWQDYAYDVVHPLYIDPRCQHVDKTRAVSADDPAAHIPGQCPACEDAEQERHALALCTGDNH